MRVCFVSLTYNQKDLTLALAKSMLEHLKDHEFEWVLLDNGDDGTREELQELWAKAETPSNLHIVIGDNTGNFASMNNAAAHFVGDEASVLCFLNNDTELLCDIITPALETLKDPNIGIVGANLKFKKTGRTQHTGIFFEKNCTPGELGEYAVKTLGLHPQWADADNWESIQEFNAVTAACFFIRRKEFTALRGFDETFDWCFEDVDLCLRMKLWRRKFIVTHPKIRLLHWGSASGGDRKVKLNLELFKGRYKGLLYSDVKRFRTMVPALRQEKL